jgi:hypothetical protein
LIQAHKAEGLQEGKLFKSEDWKDGVKAVLKSLNKNLEDAKNIRVSADSYHKGKLAEINFSGICFYCSHYFFS